MTSLPDADLDLLSASRTLAGRTATRLARQLDGKRPWTPVESDASLAAEFDVSASTVHSAKLKLSELGLLVKQGAGYYLTGASREAPGPPPRSGGTRRAETAPGQSLDRPEGNPGDRPPRTCEEKCPP